MKLNNHGAIRLAVLGGAAMAAMVAASAHAQNAKPGLYFNTDAGVNIMGNITAPGSPVQISTDAGVRWSVAAGYGFSLGQSLTLGAELETGVLYNSLSSASAGGVSISLSGDYVQVPVLGNLVLNYHGSRWVPYVGFGGGAAYTAESVTSIGNVPFFGVSGETDPAIQAMAGIRYKLSEHGELGLGYKFLGVFPSGLNMVANNSITASYTLRF